MRIRFDRTIAACVLAVLLLASAADTAFPVNSAAGKTARSTRKKLNVIFVVADDLNNDLGCYAHPLVKSPNIDRLASRGVRFDRAYNQYPLCNPSRVSFLSGRRPDTTGIIDLPTPTRTYLKDTVFLPQYFRRQGYRTMKVGKIFHTGEGFEDPASWDVDLRETQEAKNPPESQVVRQNKKLRTVVLNSPDEETSDGRVARKSIELMEKAVRDGQPFFLGTGFRRPHAPYIAPQKYFDLYSPARIDLPQEPPEHLKNIPALAFTYRPGELKFSPDDWRELRAAYYASISFMDAQLGLILDAVDRLKLWDDTAVVFFSDHGYHLGEHGGLWHKSTLFEESARVPLIVAAPGKKANAASPRVVELVDLYQTLTELCALPAASGLEGASLVPLLDDPTRKWDRAAYTEVSRGGDGPTGKLGPSPMGRSVRTERWRYTEWDFGKAGIELYDYENDAREYRNLAGDPKHAKTVEQLRAMLRANYRPGKISAR